MKKYKTMNSCISIHIHISNQNEGCPRTCDTPRSMDTPTSALVSAAMEGASTTLAKRLERAQSSDRGEWQLPELSPPYCIQMYKLKETHASVEKVGSHLADNLLVSDSCISIVVYGGASHRLYPFVLDHISTHCSTTECGWIWECRMSLDQI